MISILCSEGEWTPPGTTFLGCRLTHTMVNVFPGVVEGADREGRPVADEGKSYSLVISADSKNAPVTSPSSTSALKGNTTCNITLCRSWKPSRHSSVGSSKMGTGGMERLCCAFHTAHPRADIHVAEIGSSFESQRLLFVSCLHGAEVWSLIQNGYGNRHVPPQSSSQPLKQQSRKDPRQQQFHPEPRPQIKHDAPRQEPVH